jgi:hypothetical protein
MPPRHHIVISGTGRSGTTFLMELLTNLGLETGFRAEETAQLKNKVAHAGLEDDIRRDGCPFVVKNPAFCDQAEEIFGRSDIVIDHIFVPMRDLNAAAESRRRVTSVNVANVEPLTRLKHKLLQARYGKQAFKEQHYDGGLIPAQSDSASQQEDVLAHMLYKLMLAASNSMVPITLMRYPRITKDCPYLYEKLKPVLQGITFERFEREFSKTVRPDLVHSFNSKDR